MKASIFLRIASVGALANAAGHAALFMSYRPSHGPAETAVVAAMKANFFSFGGFMHSYWDLYFGYGLFVLVSSLVEAAILWQLAGLAGNRAISTRPMIAALLLGEVGSAWLMWRYFFLIPIVSHTLLALLLAAALATSSAPPHQPTPA